MNSAHRRLVWLGVALVALAISSCAVQDPGATARYRWWSGLGPVLPHDTFPADCTLCHVGNDWNSLVPSFEFDHAARTGVPLRGAHSAARCLLCHNDRGPVATFRQQGCVGCHEDVHRGDLGLTCTKCHDEHTWRPSGQLEAHLHSRFPLTGAHAVTSCQRCHPGAFAGKFAPTDDECSTCHQDDLARATNPPHLGLGWVNHCDRCHLPTHWRQAQVR